MVELNELLMIIGIVVIFVLILAVILWDQIRQMRKKSTLSKAAPSSPSSFDKESKTKMMSQLDKRENKKRRERILEGGTIPELSELVIYYPTRNEKITTPAIDVRGKTAIKSIVWINDQAAFVDVDGSFIGSIYLHKGKNDIDIVTIGPYGKKLATNVPVNCTSKEAPKATDQYLLPEIGVDIHFESYAEQKTDEKTRPTEAIETEKTKKRRRKELTEEAATSEAVKVTDNTIEVPESEIDPSILAALKGDDLFETPPPADEEGIALESIPGDDIATDQIPEIPDVDEITKPEEPEASIPQIPDIDKEDEIEEEPSVEEDETKIDESVKLIEEVIKEDEPSAEEEQLDDDGFPLDKMMPLMKDEHKKSTESEEQLAELKPLQQEMKGTKKLKIETKKQVLDDDRTTTILQHTGFTEREDGDLIQVIKIEKRIEHVKNKWYTTIGLVNISDVEFTTVELSEFISGTMKLDDNLPVNIVEPSIEHLPEGNKITWVINALKPQMKLFITYFEKVNPLEVVPEELHQPIIKVRR
jgi:hypothetical protein